MQILLGIGRGLTLTKSLKMQFNMTGREVSVAQQKSAFQRYAQVNETSNINYKTSFNVIQ